MTPKNQDPSPRWPALKASDKWPLQRTALGLSRGFHGILSRFQNNVDPGLINPMVV